MASKNKDIPTRVVSEQIPQSEPLMALIRAQNPGMQAPPVQPVPDKMHNSQSESRALLYGFLPKDLIQGLNELNQWKDRT